MKTKFTKGEWNQDCAIVTCGNAIIADCESEFTSDKSELFANANLIAAAPEMYEALANIKTLIEWGYSASEAMNEMQKITSEITKLLAKARGEANE